MDKEFKRRNKFMSKLASLTRKYGFAITGTSSVTKNLYFTCANHTVEDIRYTVSKINNKNELNFILELSDHEKHAIELKWNV